MELIEKYIGQWGRYQAYLYTLFALPFAISGIQVMAFSFTGAVPKVRCFIPGIDDISNTTRPEYNNPFVMQRLAQLYAPPRKYSGKTSYCNLCEPPKDGVTGGMHDPSSKCFLNESTACPYGFVYDTSQYRTTFVAEFDMTCDNAWKRSMASSFFMLGFLVGAAISGAMSDRFGRRPVVLALSFAGIVAYHLTIFTPNLPVLCLMNLLGGTFCHGAYITAFVIVMEYIGGLAATICGIWVQGVFAIGYIYVGMCAYLIRDYQWLQLAVSAPAILIIPSYWLVPESARWLIVHGRKAEAKELIVKAAAMNGRPPLKMVELESDIDNVLKAAADNNNNNDGNSNTNKSNNVTVVDLFLSNFKLGRMTAVVFFSWFAAAITYYGLSLNTGELPGNDYVNFIISGAVELPGFVIAVPMVQYWGRKPSLMSFFGFGGAAIITSTFLPKTMTTLIVVLAQIGKMGAAAGFAVIFNYSAELFPTVARNSGVGFASSCARIASISAPQIYLLGSYTWPWFPFTFYGGTAMLAALLGLILPETLGRELPETLEDGIRLAGGQVRSKRDTEEGTAGPEASQTLALINGDPKDQAAVS